MQKTEQELNMIQQPLYRQQEQYRVLQENIDLINRKCHDLKYQMEALRKLKDEKLIDEQLKELERSAMIYDSIFKTGNPVLDTVLAVVLLTVSMAAPVLGGSAAASRETGSENGGADGTGCRRRGGQRRTDSELRGGRGRADAMIRRRYDSTYRLFCCQRGTRLCSSHLSPVPHLQGSPVTDLCWLPAASGAAGLSPYCFGSAGQ